MPNNENAGMHFIHFATDHTALHEFDYDNAYRSKQKEIITSSPQTGLWTIDGKMKNVKAQIAHYRAERQENLELNKKRKAEIAAKKEAAKRKNQEYAARMRRKAEAERRMKLKEDNCGLAENDSKSYVTEKMKQKAGHSDDGKRDGSIVQKKSKSDKQNEKANEKLKPKEPTKTTELKVSLGSDPRLAAVLEAFSNTKNKA